MKTYLLFILGIFIALLSGTITNAQPSEKVKVQVINNVPDPDAGKLVVTAAGKTIGSASGLGFRQATPIFEVQGLTDYIALNFTNGPQKMTNIPPVGFVIIIFNGVKTPGNYDNPFTRKLDIIDIDILYAKTEGSGGKPIFSVFHGSTDAPKLKLTDLKTNQDWTDMLGYMENSPYPYYPDKDAAVYNIGIIKEDKSSLGTYKVDLTKYADKSLFIFTSGFVNPNKNRNGSKFGLFGVGTDGNVIEFPLSDIALPAAASLSKPDNNAVNIVRDGSLEWVKQSDANSYNVQISESNDFKNNIIDEKNITDNTIEYTSLKEETKYFWRVQGVNVKGAGPWSEIRNFTTKKDIKKPARAMLCEPKDKTAEQPVSGLLKWNAIIGSDDYIIQISKDADFTGLALDSNFITDTVCIYSGLKENTKYFWHVQGTNEAGYGDWSEAWTFTTVNPESADDEEQFPLSCSVYPNPSCESFCIEYILPASAFVVLDIYNSYGEKLSTEINEYQESGSHKFVLQTGALPSGEYNYKLFAGRYGKLGKIIIEK